MAVLTIQQKVVAILTCLSIVISLYICGCVNDIYVQIKALNTTDKMKYRKRLKRNRQRDIETSQSQSLGDGECKRGWVRVKDLSMEFNLQIGNESSSLFYQIVSNTCYNSPFKSPIFY